MTKRVLFGLLGVLLIACVKNNPDPAWIEIEKWTLVQNANAENNLGVLTHNFTDASVYVNDELLGIFELPVKLPILNRTGNAQIKIYPVVLNNGISATKKAYPFMEPHIVYVDLKQNETAKITPFTRYYQETYAWIEDFEDASVKIETDPASAVTLQKGNDPSILKYGNYYGFANLSTDAATLVAYTTGKLPLPKGKEVYLEIDYRSTNSLITGLLEISSTKVENHINIQLNKQDPSTVVWKKIYIDLREIITATPAASYYEVSFESYLDEGLSSSQVVIDNVKLVYF